MVDIYVGNHAIICKGDQHQTIKELRTSHGIKDKKLLGLYMKKPVILESGITCPKCNFTLRETMPMNACQYYYECMHCKALLHPKANDCCVFCSYGSVKCPPMRLQSNCYK